MTTTTVDARTPVIVGAGQWSNRVDQGEPAVSPTALMVEAARRAASDADAPAALQQLDVVRVVGLLSWRCADPGRLVADELGSTEARSGLTAMGGNSPQSLVSATAAQVQAGELDLALLCGGEAWRTRKDHQRLGERPDWVVQDESCEPDERFGSELTMSHDAETEIGLYAPIQMYPVFDHAHRIHHGQSIDERIRIISELYADFSRVAAANPHAWKQQRLTPAEVCDPTGSNRLVGHPYTKAVNSYEWVDQGAALLICSAEKATSLGIPRDRWVFPAAGAEAAEPPVSNRLDLHRSLGMAASGRAVLGAAGVSADDIGIVDLYSCFPSAVLIAADELGIGLDRELTVTGGMSFFGGPWNNYVTHSIATTVDRLREEPDETALVTANGGFMTKQAMGVYQGRPPSFPFRNEVEAPQAEVDAAGRRSVTTDHRGTATVEAWTVMHDRDGQPETAFVAARTPTGERTWAPSTQPDIISGFLEGHLDRAGVHLSDGTISVVP